MLAHIVYFTLKEPTPARRQELIDACKKYLTDYPGMVHFSVGTLADKYARAVNDREFDVALHMVFTDEAAHDTYQVAPRHNQFIKEQESGWAKVRVFDSIVDVVTT
jgi:hypothetical protein